MAEGTRLLSGRRSKACRGFESRPLRSFRPNFRGVNLDLVYPLGRPRRCIVATSTPASASHVMPVSRHDRKLTFIVVAGCSVRRERVSCRQATGTSSHDTSLRNSIG